MLMLISNAVQYNKVPETYALWVVGHYSSSGREKTDARFVLNIWLSPEEDKTISEVESSKTQENGR